MKDVVFDTNIYFQAAVSPSGPANACWQMVEDDIVRVLVTESILNEVEDVLSRPKLRRQFSILTDERIERTMSMFRFFCQFVDRVEKRFELERDIDDEVFINLALTVNADFLVSRDNDLLDLRFDSAFTESFPHLKIVSAFEFLQAVRAK